MIRAAPLVLVLLVQGCDSKPPDPTTPGGAQKLFVAQCSQCHLAEGQGSPLGPSLHGKKDAWTREKLVAYLKDPPGFAARDPRLSTQGKRYSLAMPTFKMLSDAELGALADHVLAMP